MFFSEITFHTFIDFLLLISYFSLESFHLSKEQEHNTVI